MNSLADVVNISTSGAVPPEQLVTELRKLTKRDAGEAILSSFAPDGQDPLTALVPETHTVAALYIL